MNKNFYQKAGLLLFVLSSSYMYADDLGLVTGGNRILNELVRAFPIAAGIAFIWVGIEAMNTFKETRDALGSMKGIGWWFLAVLFIIGIYKAVKNLSL